MGPAEDACRWETANWSLWCRKHPVFSRECRASQRSGHKIPMWKKPTRNHVNSNPDLVAGERPHLCCCPGLWGPAPLSRGWWWSWGREAGVCWRCKVKTRDVGTQKIPGDTSSAGRALACTYRACPDSAKPKDQIVQQQMCCGV